MNAKPLKAKWDLGPALGLENKTDAELAAILTADLNGEPYENGFKLAVSDGRLVLVNLKPSFTVLILRRRAYGLPCKNALPYLNGFDRVCAFPFVKKET